jgi:tetratricopeptide (TPR) repeat protein
MPSRHGADLAIFNIPFDLVATETTSPSEIPADAEVPALEESSHTMLKRGDGGRALDGFKRLLAAAPDHSSRCSWHAGVLKATQLVAPWIDDPRVTAAAEALVQYTNEHSDDPALPLCLEKVWPDLERIATRLHARAGRSHERRLFLRAAERYRLLLGATLPPPRAATLHFHLAELLFMNESFDEAAANYARAAKLDPSPKWADEARASRLHALSEQERHVERHPQLSGRDGGNAVAPSEEAWLDACADYLQNVSEKNEKRVCEIARVCSTKLHGERQMRLLELLPRPCT